MVMSDGFSMHVFADTFKKVFGAVDDTGFQNMGFNSTVNVLCSREVKLSGCVGACSSSARSPNTPETSGGITGMLGGGATKTGGCPYYIGENAIGESGTSEFRCGVLEPTSTLAFYFELVSDKALADLRGKVYSESADMSRANPANYVYLQFQTKYNHPSGQRRIRVTTIARQFADPKLERMSQGFDQEAAAALLARYAVYQMEQMTVADVLRRLDRVLIRLVARFADYNKGDERSFKLNEEFSLFPQFMYYLRRSPFVDVFNSSPDETAFYRAALLRENTVNILLMVQPALMEYSLEEGFQRPVLLDSMSLKKNVILLMDTYFHVVIWRGGTIQSWADANYQNQPGYEHLKELLERPAVDAKAILADRVPVPKFVQAAEGGSQERWIKKYVNPSTTMKDSAAQGGLGGNQSTSIVMTEDASLRDFMQALIRYAVMVAP